MTIEEQLFAIRHQSTENLRVLNIKEMKAIEESLDRLRWRTNKEIPIMGEKIIIQTIYGETVIGTCDTDDMTFDIDNRFLQKSEIKEWRPL